MDGSSYGKAIAGGILTIIVIALIIGALIGVGGYFLSGHISVH